MGIHVTPGQRHDSKAFEPTLQRVYLRRRRGRRRWPRQLAGDKGYSYPRIWRWISQRRIGRVIPTRKDQARDPNFDRQGWILKDSQVARSTFRAYNRPSFPDDCSRKLLNSPSFSEDGQRSCLQEFR